MYIVLWYGSGDAVQVSRGHGLFRLDVAGGHLDTSRWYLTLSLNWLRLNAARTFFDLHAASFPPAFCELGKSDIRGDRMEEDDQDLPTEYLLFVIAAVIVMGATAVGAFIVLIRN